MSPSTKASTFLTILKNIWFSFYPFTVFCLVARKLFNFNFELISYMTKITAKILCLSSFKHPFYFCYFVTISSYSCNVNLFLILSEVSHDSDLTSTPFSLTESWGLSDTVSPAF